MNTDIFTIIILSLFLCVFALWRYRSARLKKLFIQATNYIKNGELNPLQSCIHKGLEIHACDDKGNTLLHYAAQANNKESIQFLISLGCKIDAKNHSGDTALLEAFSRGNEISACCLIENGADIKARSGTGSTLLHKVAEQSNIEFLQLLQEKHMCSLRQMFGKDAPCIEKMKQAFEEMIQRCERANPIIGDCLIEHGADYNSINDDFLTVLDCAAKSNFTYLVQRLLKLNAIFTPKSHHDLCITVALSGDCDAIQFLIERGIRFPNPSILCAVYSGNTKAVEHVTNLQYLDIDFQNKEGWSSLMIAIFKENTSMVKLLIEMGANIHLVQRDGLAPIHIACAVGSIEIVSYLLSKGANPNHKTSSGNIPIKAQCNKNEKAIKELLIQAGAINQVS